MLDYKFIKDNLDAVKQNIINRNMTADADKVVELFDSETAPACRTLRRVCRLLRGNPR